MPVGLGLRRPVAVEGGDGEVDAAGGQDQRGRAQVGRRLGSEAVTGT